MQRGFLLCDGVKIKKKMSYVDFLYELLEVSAVNIKTIPLSINPKIPLVNTIILY